VILIYPLDLIAPVTDEELKKIISSASGTEVRLTRDFEEAKALSRDAEIIFGDIRKEFIEVGSNLKWVQSVGAGVNQIANFIGDKPITLVSARGLVGAHLAEHAFALLLAITRGIGEAIRNPGWEHRERIRIKQWEFTDRTIAIVGMGSAGQALAKRSRGFEFEKIIGVDIAPEVNQENLDLLIRNDELENYLGECDVICLTLPLTPSNFGWFNYDLLSKLKRGSIVINVSRGGLIVQSDLMKLLDEEHIYATGLDVLEIEPLSGENALFRDPRIVITPHIAGGSPLRAKRLVDQFCENLGRWKASEPLLGTYDASIGF
jgi:phosphoglycerate dehydrogenase-like enzyme